MSINNRVNAAVAAAFSLPAGAPGRENIIKSATRLRAGEIDSDLAESIFDLANWARGEAFKAQRATKASVPKVSRRAKRAAVTEETSRKGATPKRGKKNKRG